LDLTLYIVGIHIRKYWQHKILEICES